MAKTIDEMAFENAAEQYEDGTIKYAYSVSDYLKGAKYVLKEIQKVVRNNKDDTLCMANCLADKIKELKG